MGNRFVNDLKREHATEVIEGERKEEALSDAEEDIHSGATPAEEAVLQDLSGEVWGIQRRHHWNVHERIYSYSLGFNQWT